MATEVLVNDGGAPARILPFTAGSALTAGHVVNMSADGKVDMCPSGATYAIGAAFVDANSGANCSIITGRGVILNLAVSGTLAVEEGQTLSVTNAGGGVLVSGTSNVVAVALEAQTLANSSLVKCMLL
ncbi:MAG: DUF2190 family protein [Anaerolineales bacterium]|jgi:hypothetical protein|nr:DUF2190 family protein [Anaerolineales bacterium]